MFTLIVENNKITIDNYESDKNIIETLNFNKETCFKRFNLFLPYTFYIINNKYLLSLIFYFFIYLMKIKIVSIQYY